MSFFGKKSSKILNILALAALIISIAAKLWMSYSRKPLDLEMDMCDLNGNVIHVTVDAVLHRGLKEPWNWKFKGELQFGDKVFTDSKWEERLVPPDMKYSTMARPKEWVNSFRFREKEGETYYFMPYQCGYEEGDYTNYFGPASTKEEAERICDIWVHRE